MTPAEYTADTGIESQIAGAYILIQKWIDRDGIGHLLEPGDVITDLWNRYVHQKLKPKPDDWDWLFYWGARIRDVYRTHQRRAWTDMREGPQFCPIEHVIDGHDMTDAVFFKAGHYIRPPTDHESDDDIDLDSPPGKVNGAVRNNLELTLLTIDRLVVSGKFKGDPGAPMRQIDIFKNIFREIDLQTRDPNCVKPQTFAQILSKKLTSLELEDFSIVTGEAKEDQLLSRKRESLRKKLYRWSNELALAMATSPQEENPS